MVRDRIQERRYTLSKKIKVIHGERPSNLSDEDYQAILDAEEGTFYLTMPEASEVEKLQAKARIEPTLTDRAVECFTELADEAEKDLEKLPEGSQPFWFREVRRK